MHSRVPDHHSHTYNRCQCLCLPFGRLIKSHTELIIQQMWQCAATLHTRLHSNFVFSSLAWLYITKKCWNSFYWDFFRHLMSSHLFFVLCTRKNTTTSLSQWHLYLFINGGMELFMLSPYLLSHSPFVAELKGREMLPDITDTKLLNQSLETTQSS